MKPQMQAWILERRQQILAAPGVTETELEELVASGHYGDVVIVADELVIIPADVTFEPANVIYSNGRKPSEVKRPIARKEPVKTIAKRAKLNVHRPEKPEKPEKPETSEKAKIERCPECGAQFASVQGLGAHRSKLHGVLGKQHQGLVAPETEPRAAFTCPECGKHYSFRGFFENQMAKMHPTGEARERALREAGLA
jgi:uncharacterized C2H2 Zn-finger protein